MKPPLGMLGFVSALVVVALSQPTRAAACSGQSLSFDQAIVISDGAIYAGRITGAEYRAYAYDITMDIELVVRGDPVERLHRAQAGFVCNAIEPGQWGYMVRDVRDREFPGRS